MLKKIFKFINFKMTILFSLVIFILDRILKYIALSGKIFFTKNTGIALSIPVPSELLYCYIAILLIILLIMILLLINSIKKKNCLLFFAYCLLLAGAASNLLDRIKFGFIVDYLNFIFFYNNLADIMICLGVAILIFHLLFKTKKDLT